ncbi:MAG: acyl carrier protein [Proteobacteria bacterium]|nr:acyl carrier protein [Pseudomonadota bacterium]
MKISADTVKLDVSLADEYGLESVKALKLISDIEVEYDIDIDEDEARELRTLGDVIALIESKLDS